MPQHNEGCAIGERLSIPGAARPVVAYSKAADDVLRPEVARTQAVGAGDDPRHLRGVQRRQAFRSAVAGVKVLSPAAALLSAVRMSRPSGLSPDMPSSVRSRMMTFFLPLRALYNSCLGEGTDHVHVNRAHRGSTRLAQVIYCGPRRSPPQNRAKQRPCPASSHLYSGEQPVGTSGQFGKVLVCGLRAFRESAR